jgi:hypothetical protein
MVSQAMVAEFESPLVQLDEGTALKNAPTLELNDLWHTCIEYKPYQYVLIRIYSIDH